MTIINQKSISGITSITFASAGDDLLTFHSNNGTERFRIDNSGNTKITAGIVTTLTTTGNATVGGTLGVTGETTFSTHVNLGDSDQLRFGASNDLVIQHNGSDSLISETGTGDLYIRGSNNIYLQKGDGSETFIATNDDGAVELYHDNVKKIDTVSGGQRIFGYLSMQGSGGHIYLPDSAELKLGDSEDLKIYHNGSQNLILSASGQVLETRADTFQVTNSGGTENLLQAIGDGAVNLYHNGTKKFETGSGGAVLQGKLQAEGTGASAQLEIKRTDSNTAGAVGALNFTASDGHSVANIHALGDGDNEGAHLIFKTTTAAAENNPYGSGTIERMRILSTGGLTFNGDTAAANALDDYEEGTWTAALNTVNNNATVSPGNTTGYYVKVGNMVHAHYYTEATTVTSAGTSSSVLTGLPFTIANLTSGYAVATVTHTTIFTSQVQNGYAGPNQTRIVFVGEGTTSSMAFQTGSNKYLMVSLTYRAA